MSPSGVCPECEGPMEAIRLVDKGHNGHEPVEFADIESQRSGWTWKFPTIGEVHAWMCVDCGRIVLYGEKRKKP